MDVTQSVIDVRSFIGRPAAGGGSVKFRSAYLFYGVSGDLHLSARR